MKTTFKRLSFCLLFCFIFIFTSFAQMQQRDMAREEKLWEELRQTAPDAVEPFKAATAALDADQYEQSLKLYGQVLEKAPKFQHALRRIGYPLVAVGRRQEALEFSQKALDIERSPENLMGYAQVLTSPGSTGYRPNQPELAQALSMVKEAMTKSTENTPDYAVYAAQLALSAERMEEFNNIVGTLQTRFPNEMGTHYFAAIKEGNEGNFSAAESELAQAEQAGMPAEATQDLRSAIAQAKNESGYWMWEYFYYGVYLIGAWVLGLLLLFIVGKVLSVKTLHSVENSNPNDITGGGQAGLRKIYKKVIGFAGVYYYISQPIVMFLVIVLTAGVTLFFFWVGRIPIKLLAILIIVGLATIFYMIKSLFVRVKEEDPGRALTEAEAPGLWALVRTVAGDMKTRPVNEIRITPGTDLAVYERGGLRDKMNDRAERILIVGTAVLNDFSQNAFRSVLAHEYGHFSNRDTAGGDVAFRVNNHIMQLAYAMAEGGTATVYNIAFQFLRLYHFLFRRITHGATRLQEILADRVAVHLYGPEAFKEGLTHVIRREVEFNHVAEKEINAAFTARRAMQNLYELSEQDDAIKGTLEQQCKEIINRPTTDDDTHPSPHDRFKLANRITPRGCPPIRGQVWDLFHDRTALTKEMNDLLEKAIRAGS
ncbi:MAG: M48 family metalloprotease [Pyrinomonadaceae bacterium]